MTTSSRRAFLKAGALVAAPIAALAPVAVLAASDDGSKARLALLEDKQAITAQLRDVLKRLNAGETFGLDPAISAVTLDPEAEPQIAIAADGASATLRRACSMQRNRAFTGHSTMERMARFQGQAASTSSHAATLEAQLARTPQGWAITRLTLA